MFWVTQTYPIGALEKKTAERGVLKALVHSWNVHVGHNGGQSCVGELGNEQLEGQAALLCTSSVVPVQPEQSCLTTLYTCSYSNQTWQTGRDRPLLHDGELSKSRALCGASVGIIEGAEGQCACHTCCFRTMTRLVLTSSKMPMDCLVRRNCLYELVKQGCNQVV